MDDFAIVELANWVKTLLEKVKSLETRLGSTENKQEDLLPSVASAGRGSIFSPHISYVVKVTSIPTTGSFVGVVQMPADSSAKWTDDTLVTTPIVIDCPSNVSVPAIDNIVHVAFTGTYGDDEEARYGYFAGSAEATVHFELKEPYEAYQDDPVPAYVRTFDPSADDGTGAYVTNCSAETVWVKDLKDEGFAGAVGSVGHGTPVAVDNEEYGTVIAIEGLQCLPDTMKTCG